MATHNSLARIGVFYDGNWFAKVNSFYYDTRGCNVSLSGLHDFIREEVSRCEGTDKRHCSIVDLHYFRGRFSAHTAKQHSPEQLYRDRRFDDMLMREGIVQHYLPMKRNAKTGDWEEKGIDVWLALEAHELAIYKRYDVCVLVAGDGDYVPLVKKLTTLGTRTMILWWELPRRSAKPPTSASRDLLTSCTYPVSMHNVIDDKARSADPVIRNLLYEKKTTTIRRGFEQVAKSPDFLPGASSTPAEVEPRETGVISYVDYDRGLYWIKPDAAMDGYNPTGACKAFNFEDDPSGRLTTGTRVSFVRDDSRDCIKHGKRLWYAVKIKILAER